MNNIRSRIGDAIGTLAAIIAGHTVVGYRPGEDSRDAPDATTVIRPLIVEGNPYRPVA